MAGYSVNSSLIEVTCTPVLFIIWIHLQELKSVCEGIRSQLSSCQEQCRRLEEAKRSAETERDSLDEEVSGLTAGFESRGATIQRLEDQVSELAERVSGQSRLLEQREQQILEMDNELQRKDEEVKELVSKCRGLATELEVNVDLRLNIPNLRLFLP